MRYARVRKCSGIPQSGMNMNYLPLSPKARITLMALAIFLIAAAPNARPDADTIEIDSVAIASNQLTIQGTD
jgi:hypothetical protein